MASYFQDYLDFARKNSTVNLQMSLIFEMARTAITRGYTFIGFGINGIDNPSTSHELVHGDFPPDRVPQQFRLAQFNDDELAEGTSGVSSLDNFQRFRRVYSYHLHIL